MINDDILVKYARSKGIIEWPDYVNYLKTQIQECKSGFPGFSDTDLSLVGPDKAIPGTRVILDDNFDSNCGTPNTDHAPILGYIHDRIGDIVRIEIEGIGSGLDFTRDPDRKLRWGQIHEIDITRWHAILRLDSKPKPDGGPIYYYYNRHPRDSRW